MVFFEEYSTPTRASLCSSSTSTQPAAQRSSDGPYLRAPNNNSGARYHRVETWCLYGEVSCGACDLSTPVEDVLRRWERRSTLVEADAASDE